ncbi:IclR family transcriptional regulator [Micromonospora sp. NPDC005087]|uniref:IclR family transcriptional regulator n=1 Tax=Micromonospora sp. NPDC005087 TaxID=3364225 RepID=UPI0036770665
MTGLLNALVCQDLVLRRSADHPVTMRSTARDEGPNSVLGRALSLVCSFGPHDRELSLSELSRRTDIAKATVHRLINELAEWGIVERTDKGVQLGMRLFELGQLAPRQRGLHEAALPYLRDLWEATHETVHLTVLEGREVVFVEKLLGRGGPPMASRVGGRFPAHCTAGGKALLAFSRPEVLIEVLSAVREGELERITSRTIVMPGMLRRELAAIKRRGVAFEHEESAKGVTCVACPVLGSDGFAVGAVSIGGLITRMDPQRLAPAVRTAALSLSRLMGTPSLSRF